MKLPAFVLYALANFCAVAQSPTIPQKIGHADWTYIFTRMPEFKQIEREISSFEAQLQNQLKAKAQQLDAKYKAYQTLNPDTPDAIRRDKETELAYLRQNLESFQQEAQSSLRKKESDLVTPVLAKVRRAIEQVAIENGFSYIFNPEMAGGDDALLFTDEKYNISDLVLDKLEPGPSSK